MTGLISFVGAGPGAPDLITLRAAKRLGEADIVIWASSLVPSAVLEHARPGATVLDSAVMTLEDVVDVYQAHPQARIVRLHSGDPSIYGAIGEQIQWCEAHQRTWEIVPGVSSVSAAAAVLGSELTLPGVSQSVVLTRLASRTAASVPPTESVRALGATGCTMAVFLSGSRPHALQEELLAPPSRYTRDTPAAIVVRATWPDERVLLTTVGNLASDMTNLGTTLTVLVIVGDALGHYEASRQSLEDSDATQYATQLVAGRGRSHLYSPTFAHRFRRRSLPGTTTGRPANKTRGETKGSAD